jgi:predicted dehydrogenase
LGLGSRYNGLFKQFRQSRQIIFPPALDTTKNDRLHLIALKQAKHIAILYTCTISKGFHLTMHKPGLHIGLIGLGYWGNNLLRTLTKQGLSRAVSVCDINPARIEAVKTNYFHLHTTSNADEIFSNPEINAVVIATPTSTHYQLAKQALLNKKHVLVEKPLCTSTEQAKDLISLAQASNVVLMVDHIFLYNPVVRQLKKYITPDFLGKINYIDSSRINLGIYQNDTNVLWDLACHDISVINFLIKEKAKTVRAIGRINPAYGMEEIAYLFLHYDSGLLVQINSSWASPVKIRKMIIGGEKRMIIYDDIESSNKLIIYDYQSSHSEDENKLKLIDYRLGDITIPKYEISEPLNNMVEEFYDCILNKKMPLADGKNALDVITILEKAQESIKLNGQIIPIA